MNIPYRELFRLEQEYLPFVFTYWRNDISDTICRFGKDMPEFDEKLKDLSFSFSVEIKPPDFLNLPVGHKLVRLNFPFSEDVQYIGLSRCGYVMYDKDCKQVQYFSVELERNSLLQRFEYAVYKYQVLSVDDSMTICKVRVANITSVGDMVKEYCL